MKRGPKPEPTALKLIKGNPGKRPIPKGEPKPRAGAPAAPAWLAREAKAEWRRVVTDLAPIPGLLARVDRAVLATYCEEWGNFVAAQRDVAKRGVLVEGEGKRLVKNPALQVARDAAGIITRLAGEFGLTPSARARLDVTPVKPVKGAQRVKILQPVRVRDPKRA